MDLNDHLNDLEFADDICLLSKKTTHIQTNIEKLIEHSDKAGVRINVNLNEILNTIN